MLTTVLLIGGFLCFLLGAAPGPPRVKLVNLGLAFWILVEVLKVAH